MVLSLLADLTMLLGILVIIGAVLAGISVIIFGLSTTVTHYSSITPFMLRVKCRCGHSFLYDTRHGDDGLKCDACHTSFGLTRKEHA